jgi:ubiquitin-protein ligase
MMINIRELLKHPTADDPLMPAIAREFETDRETYKQKAAALSHKYAQ